jgi:WD40 repeat protein
VLSGSEDGTLRVWALDSGEPLLELLGHAGSVDSIVVSADETRVVSGSRDKTLRLWDLETGEVLRVLEGHAGFVRAIAISPVTNRVISGSTDKTICYWNAESASIDQPRGGHAEAVTLLAISADGTRVISGTRSGDLLVWFATAEGDSVQLDRCVAAPRVTGHMHGHSDWVRVLKMTADGKRAVTGAGLSDRTSRIWDLEQAVCTQVLKGHAREILDVEISMDGTRVLSLSRDRTVRLWDAETGHNIRALVSEDNHRALSSLIVGDAMLAELDLGPQVDIADKPIPRDASIALSPDGKRVLLLSQGNICVWDMDNGSIRNQGLQDLDIVSVAFDPSSERVVLGSLFGALLVWDFKQAPSILEGHTGRVLDLVVSADGKRAISAAKDDTIRIWDLGSCEQKAQLTGHAGKVDTVAISPNGRYAYSIYGDTLIAFDLDASSRLASLSFDHLITTLAVTPSGERLAIGDQSGRVHFVYLQS